MALLHRALPPRPSPLIGVLCKGKALPRPGSGTNLFPRAIRFALFARVPEAAWPHCRHSSVLLSYFFSSLFVRSFVPVTTAFWEPCALHSGGSSLGLQCLLWLFGGWRCSASLRKRHLQPVRVIVTCDTFACKRPDRTKQKSKITQKASERFYFRSFSLHCWVLVRVSKLLRWKRGTEATGDATGGRRCATPGETGPSHQLTRNGAVLSAFIIHITPSRGTEYIYTHTHTRSNLAPSGGERGGLGATGAHDGRTFPRTQSLDTRRTKCRVSRSVECLI